MENSFEHHDDHDLVVTLDRVLDALTDDRLRLAGPADRLKLALAAVRVASRVSVWAQELVAGIDSDEVAVQVHGTSTTTWLTDAARFTPREARRLIRAGEGLARFPQVSQAARAGEVSAVQAEAITGVLDDLPADFDTEQLAQGEALMVEFAHTHNSRELRMLSQHLVEVLSPETAEQSEADRLERELKGATARRCLAFVDDGHGSVLIRGSLPVADAEPFRKLIDSYAAQVKRGLEALDPLQPTMTATQRRADALVRLVDRHQQQSLAPCLGGDRPRVTMTVSWETLLRQARETGQPGGADDTGADCRGDEAAGAGHATDGHAAAATGAAAPTEDGAASTVGAAATDGHAAAATGTAASTEDGAAATEAAASTDGAAAGDGHAAVATGAAASADGAAATDTNIDGPTGSSASTDARPRSDGGGATCSRPTSDTEQTSHASPGAGRTGTGQSTAPSVLRRLLCDADILPIVLGGPSEILDVGREQRLVTATIRAALNQRDQGCVFPGCDTPPDACHAHHIQPWWNGGTTSLGNLVLLCPHHHGLIEPSHDPSADRWSLHLRPDGVSEIRPPRRVDPRQHPRIHARFLTHLRT